MDAGVSAGCLNKAPSEAIHSLAQRHRTTCCGAGFGVEILPGRGAAQCGEKKIAYAFSGKAVEQKYCAAQALQAIRCFGSEEDADFREIVQSAQECQKKFVEQSGAR